MIFSTCQRCPMAGDRQTLADDYLAELDGQPASWEWCQQVVGFSGGVACWIQGTSLRLVRHVDATGISIWAAKNAIVEQATRGQVRTAARLFGVELRENHENKNDKLDAYLGE